MGSKRQPNRKRRKELRNRQHKNRSTAADQRFEHLEERHLLAVDFVPLPLGGVATNRVDQALGLSHPSTQPALALDPSDPGNLAISNESELIVSSNAGNTFNPASDFQSLIGDGFTAEGNSDLVYTADGELKWTSIRENSTGLQQIGVATRGTGTSLSILPSGSASIARPMVVADTNLATDSTFSGRQYVSFTDEASNQVLLSYSDDGRNWTSPILVSDATETVAGNLPPVTPAGIAVGPNGDVYVAYHYQSGSTPVEGADAKSNADGLSGQIFVRRSIDGGQSFVSKTTPFGPGEADVSLNVQTVSGAIPQASFLNQGGRQPSILADPAREGHIYIIASDDPDNTHGSGDEGDIVFARSTDFGQTWDQRTLSSTGMLETMPQAAIDPFGNIFVAWYDSRLGQVQEPADFRLHVFASYSVDGGTEWSEPVQISDTNNPIDPVTATTEVVYFGVDLDGDGRDEKDGDETFSFGDYFGVEIYGGTAYVAWNGNVRGIGGSSAHQVFFDVLPVFGSLRVTGLDTDDTFLVRAMPDNPEFVEVFVNGQREYAGLTESLTGGIQFDGLAGNDTLVVDYEHGDPVPSGGIFYQGNIPEGGDGVGDSLDILSGDRSVDFQNEQSDLDAGLFVIGDSAAISFDSVERTRINATDYLRPDRFESNEDLLSATVLGSEPAITLRDLTIHGVGNSATSPDFYNVTASETGWLIVNTLFDHEQGNLDLTVHDSRGNVISTSATTTDNERVVIPVVAQESYVINVSGATNEYALEVENFAVAAPQAIILDPFSDSGMMNNDGITGDTTLRFTIQADLKSLTAQGIDVLTAEQAASRTASGAAVFVTIRDRFAGTVESGYADPLADDLFTFLTQELADGQLVASASVHILDGRQDNVDLDPAVGPSLESVPVVVQVDTFSPELTSPQMLPSSDSGMSRSDLVTNIMQPAFIGAAEPNSKIRILANGLVVGETVAASDGRWEITVEPLTDGIYAITNQAEDVAGNFSESVITRLIEIDTIAPNTPYLDLASGSDTGISDTDNVTGDNTLTFTMTTTDSNSDDHLNRFNLKYRIYARPQEGQEILVYDSSQDTSIPAANLNGGFTDLGNLTVELPELPDGVHNFKLEVEDRAGNISHDFLLPVEIDTSLPEPLTLDLLAASDSGMDDTDNVTRFERPTFGGTGAAGGVR